jgi:transcriptional regulator with XRE-family HTH domain
MDKREFSQIRHTLRKTQEELARLLCVSPKAIQSFEQGWRNIPASAERQLLFLLSMKRSADKSIGPCWEIKNCPVDWREKCTAWEFKAGNFCWLINGTFCQGHFQGSWKEKSTICQQCDVLRGMLSMQI